MTESTNTITKTLQNISQKASQLTTKTVRGTYAFGAEQLTAASADHAIIITQAENRSRQVIIHQEKVRYLPALPDDTRYSGEIPVAGRHRFFSCQ
jgi:hypothetical protein